MNLIDLPTQPLRDQVDHLFVVTTLGQTRNAISIIEQLDDGESAMVMVLGTPANPLLPNQIGAVLDRAGVLAFYVELPVAPTVAVPNRVESIDATYAGVCASVDVESSWLANTNTHYGLLAQHFHEAGSLICYFEEGLGSYKAATDASFSIPAADQRRRDLIAGLLNSLELHLGFSFVYRAPIAIRRFAGGVVRFLLAARREVEVYRAGSEANRIRTVGDTGSRLSAFFEPWTEFDRVRVAFPQLLDPALINSADVSTVRLNPAQAEVALACDELDRIEGDVPSTLLVSQPYTNRGRTYYEAVAEAVASTEVRSVFVKFHPREGPGTRQVLLNTLERSAIAATPMWRDEGLSAEALLATGRFDRCIGITSTTLLYSHDLYPDLDAIAVGREVVRNLSIRQPTIVGLDRLLADVELYESSAARIQGETVSRD